MAKPPETYPDDVRETFEYCTDCESIVVSLDQHTCSTASRGTSPSSAERADLAEADERPLEEDVLYPNGGSHNGAWAYHELDANGNPLHKVQHKAGAEVGPRKKAQQEGCYPCRRCRMIQERQQGRGEDDG